MNTVFNKFANQIYPNRGISDPELVMGLIHQAAEMTNVYKHMDETYNPPLIWGEFFHLFSGAHTDLYTPRRGYYPVVSEKSAIQLIGSIQVQELGDNFLARVPYYLESDIPVFPQTSLADIMILISEKTKVRLDAENELDLAWMKEQREKRYEEILISQGYQRLEDNPAAQNFFKLAYRLGKET